MLIRNSLISFIFELNAIARVAYAGPSRKRCPYSLRLEPQPAELMIIASQLYGSNTSILWRHQKVAPPSSPLPTDTTTHPTFLRGLLIPPTPPHQAPNAPQL